MRIGLLFFLLLTSFASFSQNGYGNQWIFGYDSNSSPSGTILDFNDDTLVIEPIKMSMELEASCAIMCDSVGKLLFYSNGCYVANAAHQMMANGDSIGKGKLETSFCKTGGSPLTQGIITLPKPGSDNIYYLFYTDIGDPYYMQPYFPLAPVTLYYAVIDMSLENGLGRVIEKNNIIIQDTFALSMMQANRHKNNKDWWLIMPKSHSNCYWTVRLTESGIDTVFKQCAGVTWIGNDSKGQAVFSPNSKHYVRFNFFYGLNIFDFNDETGIISNPRKIEFGQDTFYFSGAAFCPNSRFIYATCYTKLWQFDTRASDISSSRVLIGELNSPPNTPYKTTFNQARLAPDGKIYIAGTNTHNHLHVINHPNCFGLECNLQQYAIELPAKNFYTMANMPHYKYWSDSDTCATVSVKTPALLTPLTARIQPNPSYDATTLSIPDGKQADVQIINTLGQVVARLKVSSSETNLDLGSVPVGTYFVNIKYSDGQRESLKLVMFK